MVFNCSKIEYKAYAVQWAEENLAEIRELLSPYADVHPYGLPSQPIEMLIVRFYDRQQGRKDIETLTAGWWVVRGENGWVKCYNDANFRMKYKMPDILESDLGWC